MSTSAQAKAPVDPLINIERQYRRFLNKRWLQLNVRALAWSSAAGATGIWLATHDILATLAALALFAAVYPITVYPVLSTRRAAVISPTAIPPRPSLLPLALSSLTSSLTLRLVVSHLIHSLIHTALYCLVVTHVRPSADLGLWTPTPRHPWHINERPLFLALGDAFFLIFLALRETMGDRLAAVWPSKRVPLYVAVQRQISKSLPSLDDWFMRWNSVSLAFTWTTTYSVGYWVLKKRIWAWIMLGVVRPFIINFTRSSRNNITFGLSFHLLTLQIAAVMAIKLPSVMMMPYLTTPLDFGAFAKKSPLGPDQYLLTALRSQNKYYLHFTLLELLRVSNIPARRASLFNDIAKSPPMTHEVWQLLLLHLGHAHRTLSTRGGALLSAPAPTAQSSQQQRLPDPRAIQLKSGDIFRPVVKQKSTLASLGGLLDGPVRPPPKEVQRVEMQAGMLVGKAREEVGKLEGEVVKRIEGTQTGRIVMEQGKGWVSAVYGWMGREWARREVGRSLADDGILAGLVMDIFATLAVASIDEDTYGHVQQVLPATMECIVRFRAALFGLQSELSARAGALGRAQASAVGEMEKRVVPVRQACDTAIMRIADRFESSLAAFRFPPSIARELNDIYRAGAQGRNEQQAGGTDESQNAG